MIDSSKHTTSPQLEFPQKLLGTCDASAAVLRDDGSFLIASDEHNSIETFDKSGVRLGTIAPSLDIILKSAGVELETDDDGTTREIDIEASTVLGGGEDSIVFWIGSHARRKAKWDKKTDAVRKAKIRPNRRLLFATNLPVTNEGLSLIGSPVSNLVETLTTPPVDFASELQPFVNAERNELWPNGGGWNIEGLASSPEGHLLLGFRSPLDQHKRALVVRIDNALGMIEGQAPMLGAVQWLDLGKRGIRSIEWSAETNSWFIVSGPVDYVDVDQPDLPQLPDYQDRGFAIFTWSGIGERPTELDIDLDNLRPEILVPRGNGFFLISDDGKESRSDGRTCSDILREFGPDHQGVYARTRFFDLNSSQRG